MFIIRCLLMSIAGLIAGVTSSEIEHPAVGLVWGGTLLLAYISGTLLHPYWSEKP